MPQTGFKPKRPAKHKRQQLVIPEPIDDTVENVIDALVTSKTKKRSEWEYMKKNGRRAKG